MASSISSPTLAILAPGEMGAAIAARLSASGAGIILTNLDGRSEATLQRALSANMQHASYAEITERAAYIYSVVPPKDAFAVAEAVVTAYKASGSLRALVFVDCNAVNPESMKRMAALFGGTGITLIDASIPLYVSADPKDTATLDEFARMSIQFGLNVIPLKGEGAGIGDASAVKMANTGIVKGIIGLFTTMILAANASSPSTADALLHVLNLFQPTIVDLIIRLVPQVSPKAHRFVAEMEEVGGFAGGASARTFEGLAEIFSRMANAQGGDGSDADLLLKFVEQAKETRGRESAGGA
ncbi:6-phosphogluconate dehydrogenase C-terminal domain-like protein [Mycena leptocephala]|nr:6-phosphogluconate dehydrogenase C-terminal domain-like protein [Mycena leptocephala]